MSPTFNKYEENSCHIFTFYLAFLISYCLSSRCLYNHGLSKLSFPDLFLRQLLEKVSQISKMISTTKKSVWTFKNGVTWCFDGFEHDESHMLQLPPAEAAASAEQPHFPWRASFLKLDCMSVMLLFWQACMHPHHRRWKRAAAARLPQFEYADKWFGAGR